jgi:hypothetical protein
VTDNSSRTALTKHVLQAEWRTGKQAAWELLLAVKELFPERIDQLVLQIRELTRGQNLPVLRDRFEWRFEDQAEDATIATIERCVNEWTATNHISSPEVEMAAARLALGFSKPDIARVIGTTDDEGNEIDPPALTAYPFDETKEEFLKRAAKYFDEVVQFYRSEPKRRPIKRDVVHFKDLVAYLVGGYSWAEIAHGKTPFGLPRRSEKTVAGEARKTAALLGLALPTRRGPRPGTRRHRRLP